MASPRVLSPYPQMPGTRDEKRVLRRPQTPFNLKFKPFELQPCAMFPVLPGETLVNLTMQAQLWSDPLIAVSKSSGWTFEFYAFYSRFTDLPGWEAGTDGMGKDLVDMMTSAEALTADADGNAWTYCPPGGVDFLLEQTKRITECYFRYEGQAWDKQTSAEGVPMVSFKPAGRLDVLDKLTLASAYADRRASLDWDASGTITTDDVALAYQEWAGQADGTELDMDFDDWTRAAGGKIAKTVQNPERDNQHVPELVCKMRKWSYPNNTVEPTTGVPAVAVGWREQQTSRQMIAFPTWGWVSCFVVCRPKVFYKNQEGMFAAMMAARENWFPPNMDPRIYQPHLLTDDATGPLKATMDAGNVDYYVDLRDLLNGGEQFLNYAPAIASVPVVTLPEADGDRDYPTAADAMAVFTDTTNGRLRADGIVSVNIKTHPIVRGQLDNRVLGKA